MEPGVFTGSAPLIAADQSLAKLEARGRSNENFGVGGQHARPSVGDYRDVGDAGWGAKPDRAPATDHARAHGSLR